MCLLNGEVGGSLESTVDFGQIEEESQDGIWTIRKLAIPDIIREAVHSYGGEPYHNIIIKDLDTYGLELLEYRGEVPIYLYRDPNSDNYSNLTLEHNKVTFTADGKPPFTLATLTNEYLDSLVQSQNGDS
jgi:hypothetical protein